MTLEHFPCDEGVLHSHRRRPPGFLVDAQHAFEKVDEGVQRVDLTLSDDRLESHLVNLLALSLSLFKLLKLLLVIESSLELVQAL